MTVIGRPRGGRDGERVERAHERLRAGAAGVVVVERLPEAHAGGEDDDRSDPDERRAADGHGR